VAKHTLRALRAGAEAALAEQDAVRALAPTPPEPPDAADGPGPPGAVKRRSVSHSKSALYGAIVCARRALNRQKRRSAARAELQLRQDLLRVELAGIAPFRGLTARAVPLRLVNTTSRDL
jgi:hypothetical protein